MKRNISTTLFSSLVILCVVFVTVYLNAKGDNHHYTNEIRREMAKTRNVVQLNDRNEKLTIPIGTTLQYSGYVYGSTGQDFMVEYDKKAFKSSYIEAPARPVEEIMMPGGDGGTETIRLKALKKGRFKIKVTTYQAGSVNNVFIYDVTVVSANKK